LLPLNLRSLGDVEEHVEKQYGASLFPAADDEAFRVTSPVSLSFDISRQEAGRYRLAGHLTGEIEQTCSRCLVPFTAPIAADFDLRYVPRTENVGEGEREVEEDDLATSFYENEQIDLGQLIAEQLHLALPMKPLCTEACKGLCPQCGTNLNVAACSCDLTWQDPRLAALNKLRRT
jgi:uncharacterized protein